MVIKKLIEIRNNYQERNEVGRLENQRIIFEIVSGMVHGRLTDGTKDSTNKKFPRIPVPITHHWNYISQKTPVRVWTMDTRQKNKEVG
jgi:hypothetical protein